jgi:isoquinoline 1-oxidoreductase beta subunit
VLAEELDADWSRVRVEAAPRRHPVQQPRVGPSKTGGSSRSELLEQLHKAARPRGPCVSRPRKWACRAPLRRQGVIAHAASGRQATFGGWRRRPRPCPPPRSLGAGPS